LYKPSAEAKLEDPLQLKNPYRRFVLGDDVDLMQHARGSDK
jgi:hypothetical protein